MVVAPFATKRHCLTHFSTRSRKLADPDRKLPDPDTKPAQAAVNVRVKVHPTRCVVV